MPEAPTSSAHLPFKTLNSDAVYYFPLAGPLTASECPRLTQAPSQLGKVRPQESTSQRLSEAGLSQKPQ